MKTTVTTKDPTEAKRLAKADDMAAALWEIIHNGWRDFKHTGYNFERSWDKIREILEEYKIDVDDLVE